MRPLFLFPFLLSGCVTVIPGTESTLADARATEPFMLASAKPPVAAAKCIVDTVDATEGGMVPSMKEGDAPGTYFVRVQSPYGVALIADIEPIASGSRMVVRMSNNYIGLKTHYVTKLTKGC